MSTRFARTRIACAIAALALGVSAAPALAAGFQLNESSASGLGTAFAGGAAAAEDASTLWSNVAGLSRIQKGQGIAGAAHDQAVDGVRQCLLGGGGPAVAGP